MKFSSRDDINIPLSDVFTDGTDFATLERLAVRRGATVTRLDDLEVPGEGSQWRVEFVLRGKKRIMEAELTTYRAPNEIAFQGTIGGLGMQFGLDLVALSPTRTRMSTGLELTPESFAGRLLIQSMRLARAKLKNGYKQRTEKFAKMIEERHRSGIVA